MMRYKRRTVAAALSTLLIGVIVIGVPRIALAGGGQIANGNIVAAWGWTNTTSDASSYSAKYRHYAYAMQDGNRIAKDNEPAGVHAVAAVWNGNPVDYNDSASAGLGSR